jgi:hypothetical protein
MPLLGTQISAVTKAFFDYNRSNEVVFHNGNLYVFCQAGLPLINTYDAFKSVDGGATWTVQDQANAPTATDAQGAVWFDGANTIYCVYVAPLGAPQNTLSIKTFDLATDTWSAAIAGGPQCQTVAGIFSRPDASLLIVYDAGNPITPGKEGASRLWTVVWNGAAFVSDQDAGAPALPENLFVYASSAAMDATGRVHIAFFNFAYTQYFYRAIEPDNSLGQFTDLTPLGPFQSINNGPPVGTIAVSPSKIVIGVSVGAASARVLVGSTLAAPVFSLSAAIDSTFPPTRGPAITYDPTICTFCMTAQGADTVAGISRYIRIAETSSADPSLGWTTSAFYDISVGPAPPNYDPASGLSATVSATYNGTAYIASNYSPLTGAAVGMYVGSLALIGSCGLTASCNAPPSGATGAPYAHSFTAAGGTAPYSFAITAGSLPNGLSMDALGNVTGTPFLPGSWTFTVQMTDALLATDTVECSILVTSPLGLSGGAPYQGCRRRNDWDWCAVMEALQYYRIKFPPLCSIPKEYRNWLPWDEDFGANAVPPGSVPLHRVRGIVTPAPAAGDQTILEMRMPLGYDGLLAGIFHFYSGNGFVQGSGDIVWRVQVNLRYMEDLGNIPFALGSPQSPVPLTEGQILLSGQTVRYIVNVPNLSGLIQVGQSQITAGLVGFLWPR